jgi:hypothetical protein
VAGLGWNFGVGFIARQTDQGLPVYDDELDHFVYNGGRELVRVDPTAAGEQIPARFGGASAKYYRAKIEGLFMRFFRLTDSQGMTYWVAQDKDGTEYWFGGDESGTEPGSLICDASCARVFRWNLVLVRDVHGNEVRYVYAPDQGQSYLSEVLYNNHPQDPGRYQHRVVVDYESRPDVLTSFQTGFEVVTWDRIRKIRVYTDYGSTGAGVALAGQPDDGDGRLLVRSYVLRYLEQTESLHSLLQEVQMYGKLGAADSSPSNTLPPVRFEYQQVPGGQWVPEMGAVHDQVQRLQSSPADSLGDGRRDLLDVDADGLPDVIETDPTNPGPLAKYYLNTGASIPNAPIPVDNAPPGLYLANTNVRLMDLDGDGRTEMIHMPHVGAYTIYRMECDPLAAGQSGADRQCGWVAFGSIPVNPSIDLTTDAAEIRLLDIAFPAALPSGVDASPRSGKGAGKRTHPKDAS